MVEEYVKTLLSEYGFITTAFACLLYYVLTENKKRETKYQQVIDKNQKIILTQAKSFEIVNSIKEDVEELKQIIVGCK